MGYSTGAANSLSDMLSALQVFASTEGWTIRSGKAARSDAVAGEAIVISKTATDGTFIGGVFASQLTSNSVNDPGYYMATYTFASYNSGQGNMGQTSGATAVRHANGCGTGAIVAYHFFGGPNHIHVVLEVSSGTYTHFGLGMINKLGTVTTGLYNYGRRWHHYSAYWQDYNSGYHAFPFDAGESGHSRLGPSQSLRADCDGFSPRIYDFYDFNDTSSQHIAKCGWRGSGVADGVARGLTYLQTPSTLTGKTILTPFLISVSRGSNMYSPIGYYPDVRFVRLENLGSSASVVIGTETWRVFPIIRRYGAVGEPSSGPLGYAFLQRP